MKLKSLLIPCICLSLSIPSWGQDIKFPPKFLTFRNARISLGLGVELGLAGDGYHFLGQPDDLEISFVDKTPFVGLNLAFDIYAPNSILGLYTEVNYGISEFSIGRNGLFDDIRISQIEVPVFLKFRFGAIDSRSHFLLLMGGSYSVPIKLENGNGFGFLKDKKEKLNNFLGIGGMLGYELSLGGDDSKDTKQPKSELDKMRIILFVRPNYKLDNLFNTEHPEQILSSVPNNQLDFKDLTISVGIKVFIRLGVLGKFVLSNLIEDSKGSTSPWRSN